MSHTARKRARPKEPSPEAIRTDLRRRLGIALGISILAGIIGGVLGSWDQLIGVPPELVVNVYRVHGCRCAFTWKRSLEEDGYTVRLREYETLEYVRRSSRVPETLHGCHVAKYLGYFLEGHVPASALRRLAAERPVALGLATQAATVMGAEHRSSVVDNNSRVLLVETSGHVRPWSDDEHPATQPP
jgi:hypothetical protein